MSPNDVHDVLVQKHIQHLYHANSVTTSCSFLKSGAFLSRKAVEDQGMAQTPQYTDNIDRQYGIWSCVFFDHVDIHYRARKANNYGPVTFRLSVTELLRLPSGTSIQVTRCNPVHWWRAVNESERYFASPEELHSSLKFGDFDKMLVISAPQDRVAFMEPKVSVILDDPQVKIPEGVSAYTHAVESLGRAAREGGVTLEVIHRQCQSACKCVAAYQANPTLTLNMFR
jgi:hypothetical protein